MLYYCVITFKKEDAGIPQFMEKILKMFKDDLKIHIAKEYGKRGDNPHLNIVVDRPRVDNLRISLVTKYKKTLEVYDEDRAIRIKRVTDVSKLLYGYLQKEDLVEVLANRGFEDVPEYKPKKNKNEPIHIRMLKDMPSCPHQTCHHEGHCWTKYTIYDWVWEWADSNDVITIPSMLKKLCHYALTKRLPEILPADGSWNKDKYKQLCIENVDRDLFSM